MLLYLIILLEFKLSVLAVEPEYSVCNVRICKCDKLTGSQNFEFRNWTVKVKEGETVQELWNIECRCTRRTKVCKHFFLPSCVL